MQRWLTVGLAAGVLLNLALSVLALRRAQAPDTRLRPNVPASFNPTVDAPRVGAGTSIDALATVIGDVRIGRRVLVAPFASIRGDEGQPIRIGSRTNIQDGVVIHALATEDEGEPAEQNLVEYNGRRYAVYIGDEVSLAPQAQVHGPALIGDRVFVGMQALVFRAEIGEGAVIEPGAKVIGVTVAPGRYVPAGSVITTQAQADALPTITPDYPYRAINDAMVHVNTQLADGYLGNGRTDPARTPAAARERTPAAREESTPTPGRRLGATATPPAPLFATPAPGAAGRH